MRDDESQRALRERILAVRVRASQSMARQRRAYHSLERHERRLEAIRLESQIALHTMWHLQQELDGVLHELDARIEAERNAVN